MSIFSGIGKAIKAVGEARESVAQFGDARKEAIRKAFGFEEMSGKYSSKNFQSAQADYLKKKKSKKQTRRSKYIMNEEDY